MKSSINDIVSLIKENPDIKKLNLTEKDILKILEVYEAIAFKDLLDNGHIELGNGMIIEVIQLLNRVHVLRGTSYRSNRKYKLKLTMEDNVYKRIEEYYDKLREEIL